MTLAKAEKMQQVALQYWHLGQSRRRTGKPGRRRRGVAFIRSCFCRAPVSLTSGIEHQADGIPVGGISSADAVSTAVTSKRVAKSHLGPLLPLIPPPAGLAVAPCTNGGHPPALSSRPGSSPDNWVVSIAKSPRMAQSS